MCSSVHGFENSEKKEKETYHFRTCYSKGNYLVNVSVFGLVDNELGSEKKWAQKKDQFFFRCKLGKLG